ncbi:hypothetical protein [Bacillus sp. SLBN-46]|nr:hypothetical protein [Bacillus sp. SLBN-46]
MEKNATMTVTVINAIRKFAMMIVLNVSDTTNAKMIAKMNANAIFS